MSNIKKTIDYKLPNKWMSTSDSEGKKSTQEYNGPESLTVWIGIETNEVEAVYDSTAVTEMPMPLDMVQVDVDCNAMTLHCMVLWGGVEEPIHYEIPTGPASELNPTVADPTHVSEVYDYYSVTRGYNQKTKKWGSVKYSTPDVDDIVTPEMTRASRNSLLETSDANVSPDMPEGIKTEWLDYRQKLRDLPENWDLTKPHLIVLPQAPDEINASSEVDCSDDDADCTATFTTVVKKVPKAVMDQL